MEKITNKNKITINFCNIHDVEEFKAIFAEDADDGLLLCYEESEDSVTKPDIVYLYEKLKEWAAKELEQKQKQIENYRVEKYLYVENNSCNRCLHLYAWECSSDLFNEAKRQIGKVSGKPLLLVVYRQQISDALRPNEISELYDGTLINVLHRLINVQTLSVDETIMPSTLGYFTEDKANHTLHIDITKMLNLGKKLMSNGKAEYAEKVFVKALRILKAMQQSISDANTDMLVNDNSLESFEKTTATCLSWIALSQLVQGKNEVKELSSREELISLSNSERYEQTTDNDSIKSSYSNMQNKEISELNYLERLQARELPYYRFCSIPLSNECRVCALSVMMAAAPKVWSSKECSIKKLQKRLEANPLDHECRAALIITLFLSGDVERALTEAVKLKVSSVKFGDVAIAQITHFLGKTHSLTQQMLKF